MMSEWYRAESMNEPQEWDTATSPNIVYQRKNITQQTRTDIDGENERTVYTYSERTMTREEYAAVQAELESPATKMIMQSLSAIEMRQATIEELMEV